MVSLKTIAFGFLLAQGALAKVLPRHVQTRTSGGARELTNAERFARGLPPKKVSRLFNATATHAAPAKRSGLGNVGYIQAIPSAGGASMYAYLSGSNFQLTTDSSQATQFTWAVAGNEVPIYFADGAEYMCTQHWSGPDNGQYNMESGAPAASVVFGGCPLSDGPQTTTDAHTASYQLPSWDIPSFPPDRLFMDFFNYDGTTTYNMFFFSFDSAGTTGLLGSAISIAGFANAQNVQRVTLMLLDALP
ncbi:hypothetical protein M231_02456 [Tremella mesenterica]|uniref:Uncharacterized protein n=1 Tax=Tremella mesenterica TaxID=5217 RepID=A0A4Q1BQS8_TREME|nr:uncharacterized protein TREMEDRAFT_72237 [Tremella mesenterica DSM 1558]EIW67399.1 hypothetical protein TREMEDRAFT_72237 [Tremella mesenterica DSM 1558]RXK40182.1 hypothetical protein M231_02456 [Tremella mesenterica]